MADFIVDHSESILQEWDAFARTLEPAATSMTDVQLRNHATAMLKLIVDDLRTPQTLQQQIAKSHGNGPENEAGVGPGEAHGLARLGTQFTIEQLVSEFRALRSSVLRLWKQSQLAAISTDVEDIIRFDEAIDQLVAASVSSFAQAVRRATATEVTRRNQFLAMLAHELRNPLAPISNAATLLTKAKGDEAVFNNAGRIIERQVSHMASLVNDLLDVSRVTQGLVNVKLDLVDIAQIIDGAVEQVTPLIQARRHQFTVLPVPEGTFVQADKKRLVQVLTNLLTNAAKYTPEGGHIQLKVQGHNNQVAVTVEDNGTGIAPEFVPHVFDLFTQAEHTPDRMTGGLGLGLTLVKNLVKLHGGQVTCSSPGLGKGSQFVVWLPRQFEIQAQVQRTGTLLS